MAVTSNAMITSSIFRTYDIRGVVDRTLTKEGIVLIGQAIGSLVLDKNDKQIAVGRDGRLSSPEFSALLIQGILSTGCDVIDIGMVPTPLLYYAAHVFEKHSGVMLTGSHNPSEYNGLKTVIQGRTLAEDDIKALYQRIVDQNFYVGTGVKSEVNVVERYIASMKGNIHLSRPLKVVVDAGNGVTGEIAPLLFRALGCEVHELHCEIDGRFPHHHPDPSEVKNLQDLIQVVAEQEADVGLAFDGDGDRLGIVTNRGDIIWPDRLLMLYARSILEERPGAKIIFDVKCSNQLAQLIDALGGEAIMWKTGHSLIKAKMAEINADLAGEMSGHFFFKDRWFGFDDALYAGARLLEILAHEVEDSASVFASIPNSINTPELRVAVADEEKFHLMQALVSAANFQEPHDVNTIDGLRISFADGWGLVRPSNTTPYLILRFEAVNHAMLEKIQQLFRDWMLSVRPDLVLPF